MSWEAIRLEGGDVHVHPLRDLIEHDPNDCICGPTVEPVPREDGSMGWLISHHALDAREQEEASMEPCPYCTLPDGWDACPIHRDGE
jgi:hypothetical protein